MLRKTVGNQMVVHINYVVTDSDGYCHRNMASDEKLLLSLLILLKNKYIIYFFILTAKRQTMERILKL